VERAPRGGDRPVDVLGRGVRSHPDHLLGGRVHVLVGPAAARRDELTVDQQPLFVQEVAHGLSLVGARLGPLIIALSLDGSLTTGSGYCRKTPREGEWQRTTTWWIRRTRRPAWTSSATIRSGTAWRSSCGPCATRRA